MTNPITKAARRVLGAARTKASDAEARVSALTEQHAEAAAAVRKLSDQRHGLLMQKHMPGSAEAKAASREADELARQIAKATAAARVVEADLARAKAEQQRAGRSVAIAEASPSAADAAARLAEAQATAASIEGKRRAARDKADDLAAERAKLALPAHSGDEPARQRLDEVHREIALAASESAGLDAAAAEAAKLVQAAEAEVAAEERAQAAREAEQLVDQLGTLSQRADALLGELGAILDERLGLLRRLAATKAYPAGAVRGLMHGRLISDAMKAGGLSRHVEIPGIGRPAGRPLAEADGALSRAAPPLTTVPTEPETAA